MKKTVLITGCSSGFGKASARYFAGRGWNVIATMRDPDAEKDLSGLDGVLVTRLDVQDSASIDQAIHAGIERFGRIDALVNNAGFGLFGVFEGTPRDKIQQQFDVNVFGTMDVTRAILPHFRQNKAGLILNVTSGAGVFGLPMLSLYCASKFALEGFSEALSYELAPLGITVKLVEPGGSLSTNFVRRNGSEAAEVTTLSDYDAFVAGSQAVFEKLGAAATATGEDVAKVIYEAATDGSDWLRYAATDDIKPMIKARRETSEEEYIAFMRSHFMVDVCEGCIEAA
ncbi:SDR family oxidoreductase [Microvirga sp. BT688]|uniref:SDR family oxidoreductase n=1 Tax=Microvirga sp. TaxID=1873136 RepID=UPI0016847041|nr:SDR family oxidoreductase [Microvirga sp.]MBD2749151.1 SDR family oxidoreductase [Microvirga sp.]